MPATRPDRPITRQEIQRLVRRGVQKAGTGTPSGGGSGGGGGGEVTVIETGVDLDGSGTVGVDTLITIQHEDSGATAGTYGSTNETAQFTVDARGHITSVSNITLTGISGVTWFFDPPEVADFPTSVTEGAGVSGVSFTDDLDIGLIYQANITSTDHMSARVLTAPATPFTITGHFTHLTGAGGALGNAHTGIVLRNSSSGLRNIFGFQGSAGSNGLGIRRATGTTFTAAVTGGTASGFSEGLWLRIIVTTDTNIEYQYSNNGKTWAVWQSDIANGRISGLNQIGLGISRSGTGSPQTLVCDHWAIT